MKLSTIFENIETLNCYNDLEINKIEDDSRKIGDGDMFIAVKGVDMDGHNFIDSAVRNGAVALVVDEDYACEVKWSGVEVIRVKNSAVALGLIAANFYGNPSEKLELVGITGTNGKTTTATLLYQLFTNLGFSVGLLSTIKNYICLEQRDTINTTPNVLETNRLLSEMVKRGCRYCFMEVSSHAVVQHRILGLVFSGAIFTNLTQDHLDYHKTMINYRDSKKLFFDRLPSSAWALTNIDDKNGLFMLQNTKATQYNYSITNMANFKAKVLENTFEGMKLYIDINLCQNSWSRVEFDTPFVGSFNAYNLMAVLGGSMLLLEKEIRSSAMDSQMILTELSGLLPVSGRFETIAHNGITAIIDYAHTPDAINNVLSTISDVKKPNSSVITVVGCGGDRDKTKRPLMAKEAVLQSDISIFTSDNPRTENTNDIINDMLDGLDETQKQKTIVIPDRRQAIGVAYRLAKQEDIILIAGKGHENYQIIGKEKHHFSDKEEIIKVMNNHI